MVFILKFTSYQKMHGNPDKGLDVGFMGKALSITDTSRKQLIVKNYM